MIIAIMLEDVRRLKLETLNQELEKLEHEYAAMFDEVNAIYGQLWVLDYAEKQVNKYKSEKHSLWERFTKRKEYLAYQTNLETLKDCPKKTVSLENRLARAELETIERIEHSGILQKIESKKNQIKKIKNATILEEMGMTTAQAVELLHAKHVDFGLGKGDEEILQRYLDYKNQVKPIVIEQNNEENKKLRNICIGTSVRENLIGDKQS